VDISKLNEIELLLLKNEISVLKRLDSSFVMKLLWHQQINNNIYLVTEYCNQGDLKTLLNGKPVKEQTAIKIIQSVLLGLRELQKNNVFFFN